MHKNIYIYVARQVERKGKGKPLIIFLHFLTCSPFHFSHPFYFLPLLLYIPFSRSTFIPFSPFPISLYSNPATGSGGNLLKGNFSRNKEATSSLCVYVTIATYGPVRHTWYDLQSPMSTGRLHMSAFSGATFSLAALASSSVISLLSLSLQHQRKCICCVEVVDSSPIIVTLTCVRKI